MFLMPDGERFDRVVLATGAQPAPTFVGPRGAPLATGLPAPIPVKGQMLALATMDGGPRHVIHTRDVYIAPKSRWTLVGATDRARPRRYRRRPRRHRRPSRARGRTGRRAGRCAGSLRHGPASARAVRTTQPLIGQTAIPGVVAALGHYRNGVLLAPATAEIVADQIIDGKVSPLAAAFDPLRFDNGGEAPHSPSGAGLDN